MLGEVKQVMRV